MFLLLVIACAHPGAVEAALAAAAGPPPVVGAAAQDRAGACSASRRRWRTPGASRRCPELAREGRLVSAPA